MLHIIAVHPCSLGNCNDRCRPKMPRLVNMHAWLQGALVVCDAARRGFVMNPPCPAPFRRIQSAPVRYGGGSGRWPVGSGVTPGMLGTGNL